MQVILKKDVQNLGEAGDVVSVKDGYARNFLFPKKLAIVADAKAVNDIKSKQSSEKHRVEVEKAAARELAKKLAETTVKIVGTAGADGRFYGSVTTKDISEALASQFGIEIDKRKMELDMQIKAFGTYKVEVKLYTGISGKFNVQVVEK